MNEIKITKETLGTILPVVEKYGKPVAVVGLGFAGFNYIKNLAKDAIKSGTPMEASFMGLSIKLNQPMAIKS